MEGNLGIACISDYEPQPLLDPVSSRKLCDRNGWKDQQSGGTGLTRVYQEGRSHFQEMSGGMINATELVAALICKKDSIVEGIRYVQRHHRRFDVAAAHDHRTGIYAARDRSGTHYRWSSASARTATASRLKTLPTINLGLHGSQGAGTGGDRACDAGRAWRPSESPAGKEMRICSFLWVYYGYPTSSYEGVNVEADALQLRQRCSQSATRARVEPDLVAGVPDSGIAHAIGYANEAGIPYARPFIKYTPTWPRSFMPTNQKQRELIARMKLLPVPSLIKDKKLLLIDDSIVRGTQLRDTTQFLYQSGAKEVHIRPACPPLIYGCKYLNFSRSKSEMELITRRVIKEREGEDYNQGVLDEYSDPCSERYAQMLEDICKIQNFTSLRYHRLDDLLASIGIEPCKVCTYCFNGKE